MPAITIKNIPDQLYKRVKERAARNRRSINSEIIYIIEKATTSTPASPQEQLLYARKLREKSSSITIRDEELTEYKTRGRK